MEGEGNGRLFSNCSTRKSATSNTRRKSATTSTSVTTMRKTAGNGCGEVAKRQGVQFCQVGNHLGKVFWFHPEITLKRKVYKSITQNTEN